MSSPAVFAPVLAPALAAGPQSGARRSALLLALLALGLYARTLGFPALEASDAPLAGADSLVEAWRAGGLGGASLYLEGLPRSALVPRAVNLGLHAGATLLVFALLGRLGLARGPRVLVAALHAAHPLRVESVAWLSERGALLGGFAFLLGASLALARPGARRSPWAAAVLRLAWLVLLFGAGAAWSGLGPRANPVTEPDLAARLASLPRALGALAGCWAWPAGLTPHHAHPALAGASSPGALAAGWVALALAAAALFAARRRFPAVAAGGFLFLVLGAVPVPFPARDGLFTESGGALACLGLELALGAGLFAALPRLAPALGAALVVACAARASLRLSDWRAEPALQARALAVDPADFRAHDALGVWHLRHGRLSAAQRAHERALELRPLDERARTHLGELWLRRALLPGAEGFLSAARAQLDCATRPGALAALGEVLERAGDPRGACAALALAVAGDPHHVAAHVHLGMARLQLGESDAARAAFTRATELDPRSAEAWCGLGIVHFAAQDPDAASVCLERALALEPDHPEARATLGRIQETRGLRTEAEASYRRALGVHPDHADALYALGALLVASGRGDEALRYLDRACELPAARPHVRAHLASARLHLARGDRDAARARLRAVVAFNPEHAEARALLAELDEAGR